MKLAAETRIKSERETVWRLSQTPHLHVRWDLRFTNIEYLPRNSMSEPQRFRYATRIGFGRAVSGWGETIGDSAGATSALRFGSADRMSLISDGAGSWTYGGQGDSVRFSTVYDYATRYGVFGRILDLAFRPLMVWATRWSFDRLRIWIEDGIQPETSLRLWLVKTTARSALAFTWIYEGLVPKILFQRADEIALVGQSGLYAGTPGRTLVTLGVAEIGFGLWLLSGRFERKAALLSSIAIACLAALVISVRPSVLSDPFGGISKNLGLLACAVVVWTLSTLSPSAARAKPGRGRGRGQGRRTAADHVPSPFAEALREELALAAPLVRAHMTPGMGVHSYEGVMRRVWRVEGPRRWLTAPFLWIGSWAHTLFPETGDGIPFQIVNRCFTGPDGRGRMTFERTFHFQTVDRRFEATTRYDDEADVILDVLGSGRHLLVELVPSIENGGLVLRSNRQWLTPFRCPVRIRLPRILAGEATIEEWQESETTLGIRVTISNRLFGPFFGYEGTFTSRVALSALAIAGTAAYAASFGSGTVSNAAAAWGARVALAAGCSWPIFGFALIATSGPSRTWDWFDACLRTMAVGIAILSLATLTNSATPRASTFLDAHLGILLLADVSMAGYFVRQARRLAMPATIALVMWIGVLNGAFMLLLLLP